MGEKQCANEPSRGQRSKSLRGEYTVLMGSVDERHTIKRRIIKRKRASLLRRIDLTQSC
jgi:hypothetical protein